MWAQRIRSVDGRRGDDSIAGGGGLGDEAIYVDASGPVQVDLLAGVATGQGRTL